MQDIDVARCIASPHEYVLVATGGWVHVTDIINKMKDRKIGLHVKSRRRGLRTYEDCFIGNEMIDWLIDNGYAHPGARTKAEHIGERIWELGYIQHVGEVDQELKDDSIFYRFSADTEIQSERKNEPRPVFTHRSPARAHSSAVSHPKGSQDKEEPQEKNDPPPTKRNLKSSNAEQEPTIGGNITPRTDSNKDRRRKNKTDVPDFVEMTESDEDTALLRELLASKPPSGGPKRIKARPHHPQLLIVAEGEPLALIDTPRRGEAGSESEQLPSPRVPPSTAPATRLKESIPPTPPSSSSKRANIEIADDSKVDRKKRKGETTKPPPSRAFSQAAIKSPRKKKEEAPPPVVSSTQSNANSKRKPKVVPERAFSQYHIVNRDDNSAADSKIPSPRRNAKGSITPRSSKLRET